MLENFNFSYFINFYWYLISKRTLDFIIFFVITFILSLFPYAVVWLSVISLPDANQLSFYGDGSIIILCSGILCSYFALLFDFKSDGEKKVNVIINLFLMLLYICLLLVFRSCQLNFNRSWCFVQGIALFSAIVLLLTVLAAAYLNFRQHFSYKDVEAFVEEMEQKKLEREALKSRKSKSGVKV